MSTITYKMTPNGYTKSIMVPGGSITAYVQKKTNEQSEIYVEKKTRSNGGIETENMMFHMLTIGLKVQESNIDPILLRLAQIRSPPFI